MKSKMNILLLIVALTFIVIALYNLTKKGGDDDTAPKEPQDGEVQIRQQGETFWTYRYVRYPGWKIDACFFSLEEARQAQKKAEDRLKDEVVIKFK
jgi:hypothetical protein